MNNSIIMMNSLSLGTNEITFKNYLFERFIEFSDVKEKTMSNYRTFLKPFILYLKDNDIKNPTRETIKDYKEYIKSQELSSGTKQQYFQAVKHFFKWTSCEGLFPNISEGFKGFKVNIDNTKKEAFNEEEVQTILDSLDINSQVGKRNKAMILLAITGGLRIIELQRANIEDLQTIRGQKVLYIQGKGRDEKDEYIKIIQEVDEALQDYLSTRPEAKKSEPLFTGTSNNQKGTRITETSLSRIFKTIFKQSGFDSKKLTSHSLRHSSNTLLFKSGADLYRVQKHARHKNPQTTEIYLHTTERDTDTSEEDIYNQIFHQDKLKTRETLQNEIKTLSEEQLKNVFNYIQMMKAKEVAQ